MSEFLNWLFRLMLLGLTVIFLIALGTFVIGTIHQCLPWLCADVVRVILWGKP